MMQAHTLPEVEPDLANARARSTVPGRQVGDPLSVGVDAVSVAEVSAALDRFGDRYVRRVFTSREAAYCLSAAGVAGARFAARFAAKEAAIKALEPGRRWTDWRAIEVRRRRSGACGLLLRGDAAALAERRGIRHLALSMSHEGDLAVAVVVALRAARAARREHRHV
jgi:holo-[acyl-carrier protein] synthase